MNDHLRPDPDALLAAVQKEEAKHHHGKLKIFFGMVAGVGKTYAMLEAAQQRKAEGVDVVIGYVETHHRAETDALVVGLPSVPRQKLEYRGSVLEEMDLDAILARKPQLVLVDELAHTNVPGARHPKRYQDVLELLDAGIDVYTTVNVQHFESRADAVRQITGVTVRETVPDSILDLADDIELIDLAPDDLLKRLAEGKVYTPDRAELASHNFFRQGNLTALREMALRLTAERVDHQLQDYMTVKQIPGPWKSGERLMVAVSPSPLSERLVRWTRRMAYSLEAPWIAVYVEGSRPLSPTAQAQLVSTLKLVRELGGEPVVTAGEDITAGLLRIARQRNVSQIVVGKPKRNAIQEYLSGGSVVNRLARNSGNIDVYVVSGDQTETTSRPLIVAPMIHSGPNQYLLALLVVGAVITLNIALVSVLHYQAIALGLLLTVTILGMFVGRGPVLLAAALSAVLWDFLFIPPQYTFIISKVEDVMMFSMYFFVALIMGNLASRLRRQEQSGRLREERMAALYAFAREVSNDISLADVIGTAITQIQQLFKADVAVLLRTPAERLADVPQPASTFTLDEKERSVADWAFQNKKTAGRNTDTLPLAQAQYFPLLTPGGAIGIIGVKPRESVPLSFEQEALLETFVSQIALAIERTLLDDAAEKAKVLEESERLYSTLLNSISHELRTPLATITGAASGLLDERINGEPQARQALGQDLQDATERLNRLVDNLLDMTRLESGQLKLNLEWCDVSDLINVSLNRVEKQLADHEVVTEIAPDLPLIRVDFVLIEQALVNLLHNAAIYTPPGTRVRVQARVEDKQLVIVVADRGPGVPPGDQVFDKFYRAPGAAAGGTGLGLSISRGLVEAHGGTVTAENRANGGARFIIRLPITEAPKLPKETA